MPHTPGPWTVRIWNDEEHYIPEIWTRDFGGEMVGDSIRKIEDAQLASAAPDLLAALELLLNVEGAARHGARLPGFLGLDVEYHFSAARAAIARATGADLCQPFWRCPDCGREYDDIENGPCPSDDCPSRDNVGDEVEG